MPEIASTKAIPHQPKYTISNSSQYGNARNPTNQERKNPTAAHKSETAPSHLSNSAFIIVPNVQSSGTAAERDVEMKV